MELLQSVAPSRNGWFRVWLLFNKQHYKITSLLSQCVRRCVYVSVTWQLAIFRLILKKAQEICICVCMDVDWSSFRTTGQLLRPLPLPSPLSLCTLWLLLYTTLHYLIFFFHSPQVLESRALYNLGNVFHAHGKFVATRGFPSNHERSSTEDYSRTLLEQAARHYE